MKQLVLCIFSFLSSLHLIGQADTSQVLYGSQLLRSSLDALPFDLNTSIDWRFGPRVVDAVSGHKNYSLAEMRWQLNALHFLDWGEIKAKVDLGYNLVQEEVLFDPRELYLDAYPTLWWNLRAGRQILTWGKGDLHFINDLFPKDFQSFFTGRDVQYLKAPSDAIKLSLTPSWLQINIVYTPQFDPDRYVTGEQIAFFDTGFQQFRTPQDPLPAGVPNQFFRDDELAWRLQKNIKGLDLGLYGYHGFWPFPSGFDPSQGHYTFPSLNVYGFSAERILFGGVIATELGYYYSSDDATGDDPLIRNSEWRGLINYSRDFKGGFSATLQYYIEVMQDHEAYLSTFQGAEPLLDKLDMVTLRLTQLASKQRLRMSIFTFYGLAYKDIYVRPHASYQINDFWRVEVGGNLFGGKTDNTFWNQFKWNNNAYMAIKWSI